MRNLSVTVKGGEMYDYGLSSKTTDLLFYGTLTEDMVKEGSVESIGVT